MKWSRGVIGGDIASRDLRAVTFSDTPGLFSLVGSFPTFIASMELLSVSFVR